MKNQIIELLNDDNLDFPPLKKALAEPNGLLAVGGDLSVERLQAAYQAGIFPWYSDGDPIMWWSPDPRGIILLDQLRINKTLRKVLKQKNFTVTLNQKDAVFPAGSVAVYETDVTPYGINSPGE